MALPPVGLPSEEVATAHEGGGSRPSRLTAKELRSSGVVPAALRVRFCSEL